MANTGEELLDLVEDAVVADPRKVITAQKVPDVIHPLFERGEASRPVRQTRTAAVEKDEARE